ncbi:MAG TPA: helix-turn-helix domain-containing protein [Hyphomicrobium sp.]|nr:helix-turn-helix domain-containing protein [Hyphomicrobium sp.]
MAIPGALNERAATPPAPPGSLWHVDDAGWAMFAGPLHHNAPHAHSAAVYLAGLYGTFRLRIRDGDWVICRSAVIRAGTPYEFDVAGDPLGVFYLEPNLAGPDALGVLTGSSEEVGGALVGQRDGSLLRACFERRSDAGEMHRAMMELLQYGHRRAHRSVDMRITRAVEQMQMMTPESYSTVLAAEAAGLSASRFQHLFTREVGVPFRRYRLWHRLRVAIREAARGSSLTNAAHTAGFADQAHFSRAFRATFGAPPSRGL